MTRPERVADCATAQLVNTMNTEINRNIINSFEELTPHRHGFEYSAMVKNGTRLNNLIGELLKDLHVLPFDNECAETFGTLLGFSLSSI